MDYFMLYHGTNLFEEPLTVPARRIRIEALPLSCIPSPESDRIHLPAVEQALSLAKPRRSRDLLTSQFLKGTFSPHVFWLQSIV